MTGPSFSFVGFAILVAILAAAVRSRGGRQTVLLVASVVFLVPFSRDPMAFLPLACFVGLGYAALRWVERPTAHALPVAIGCVLLAFFWLKKYVFVPPALWLSAPYVTVGVSYILFRILHLVIEGRNDASYARISFMAYLGYLIRFNTLVAGPIQSYDDYREQQELAASRRVDVTDIGDAVERIIVGLVKTNVLAALLAHFRDVSLARLIASPPTETRLLDGALVFALYPLFLYCNFAGYIDIMIGVGRLLGERLPENFDRPFSATSFIDFWNRWHITLSRWLRTYVYNPLLLALLRRFPSRRLESWWATLAFFVTFFLVGVWHGQTGAFLFFGFLQGLGVSVNKLYQLTLTKRLGRKQYERRSSRALYEVVARGLTFTWFTFTLTWFWAGWNEATRVWGSMSVASWLGVWSGIWLVSALILSAWEVVRQRALALSWGGSPILRSRRVHASWFTALFVVVVVVAMLNNQSAPEIVYKNF
jgi:D-alanyl-lipoteichoic acid acyltransferase DltB (MBOAT superfamily)